MIDGQVTRRMWVSLVGRTPVAVHATPGAEDASTQALPLAGAVQGVVTAAVRLACVHGAATTEAARQDAADGADLHRLLAPTAPRLTLVTLECTPVDIAISVIAASSGVYSPRVLGLGSQ